MKNYYDWDSPAENFKYNVVEKQVISHQRYVVYSREYDEGDFYLDWKVSKSSNAPVPERFNKNDFHKDMSRNVMIDFLSTIDGKKILEFGIPLSIETYKNAERISTVFQVIAHFTNDQRIEYEKYLMLKRLSGD
jgi:hypothetical protein